MQALIIDTIAKERIKKVIDYAENFPFSISMLKKVMSNEAKPPGDNENYKCHIDYGYVTVFTIDQAPSRENPEELIWLKHISISFFNHLPSIPATALIVKEFGFKEDITDKNSKAAIWIENEDNEKMPQAINIVERYEQNN